ncbi:MAG: hypothetical protein DRJ01_02175 [Bacteroidetes bacterium]|nr:MAG: hypothetical protein DRJ01_02175 [Bacteroidota bacterium]
MTLSQNVEDNLNDKNTKTPPSKDPSPRELMKRFKAARKAKKKGKRKKSYSYMSALEPRKTARDILINTGQIKEATKYDRLSIKDLRKIKVPLSANEREQVMEKKAVWHHGPNGEETPAVWKAKDKTGNLFYITNTHRAMQVRPTLKGAIAIFHKFIKGTA